MFSSSHGHGRSLGSFAVGVFLLGLMVNAAMAQTTTRVSVSSSEVDGIGDSSRASVSADGRYIAFYSDSDNLVSLDANGVRDVFVRDRLLGTTVRISINASGVEGNEKSDRPSISGDGRFVSFSSKATNLVANDFNMVRDIFVHDRDVDADGIFDEVGAISITRMSVSSFGGEANGASNLSAISSDGRHISFRSTATNLVSPLTNGLQQIYVHDRQTGSTVLVSADVSGVQGNADSDRPALSPNGRYVAYYSDAHNLVPGDTQTCDPVLCPSCTGSRDIFLRDRDSDNDGIFDENNATMERVSVSTAGTPGNGSSSRASISADGRYVLFKSFSNNLVTGDTNNADDVFVRDRVTNTTRRVSISSSGEQTQATGPVSQRASVSVDGRYIAFVSEADDLVPGDTNLVKDIFVRDRATNTTVRVSVGPAGLQGNGASNRPSISADGRFVAFYSDAFNIGGG